MIWVDVQRRANLRDIEKSLYEVLGAVSDEALRSFQERSLEVRKAWIDRFDQLRSTWDANPSQLSASDAAELASMKHQLAHMKAKVDRVAWQLYR